MAEEWVARVIACAPHTSARALQESLHLAVGSDKTKVSRWSVGGIRSAWCEMHERMVQESCRVCVGEAVAVARRLNQASVPVVLSNVQDVAQLRLLATTAVLMI